MKVLILGIDGYLGWPLTLHLASRGHHIVGVDNFLRRRLVEEEGSWSAIPILDMDERCLLFRNMFREELQFYERDIMDYQAIEKILEDTRPDAIVHLGEIPCAPYSMRDVHACNFTHKNNVIGTLNVLHAMRDIVPNAHLIKLGTMGEYGTPNIDIPEGYFEIEYRGRRDTLPFPKQAGSFYHLTKVHDTNNIIFTCRVWGLRSTDIQQGPVYGTRIGVMRNEERLATRFDFDAVWGTVMNRYCAEAVIEHPLTPFGKGTQKRGFLPLRDSMQCLTIAVENPPEKGEYRTFNQFEGVYDVTYLAKKVQEVGRELGLKIEIGNLENPRKEKEEHYYNPDHENLLNLGYEPTTDMESELKIVLEDLLKYKDRILEKRHVLIPNIRWDGTKKKSKFLGEK